MCAPDFPPTSSFQGLNQQFPDSASLSGLFAQCVITEIDRSRSFLLPVDEY